MDLSEGKMSETPSSESISTKQRRIAELARRAPEMALTTLAHHMDLEWLREAYRGTKKRSAVGVDGQTAEEYGVNLEENLRSLLDRAKSGSYFAPPVRRKHIPKGTGSETRPIGIPCFEDKVLQRAVAMLLVPVYEQDFYGFSYGFRPGRSPHQAVEALSRALWRMGGGWVIDLDIRKFFDTLDHAHLREILRQRIRDGVLLRLIGKWLNAGVLEEGCLEYPEEGTPQGGVISPLLANIYLHEVLDRWYVEMARPRLRGQACAIRFADDAVLVFTEKYDAERILAVLPKRFGKYGLALHPEKTRMIGFHRPSRRGEPPPQSFDFLGFTFFWGKSRKGRWIVQRKTAKSRLCRALKAIGDWCRQHRHLKVRAQWPELNAKLRGHYQYYGIGGNYWCLFRYYRGVLHRWRKWLNRRSHRGYRSVSRFQFLLDRYPLVKPWIPHPFPRRVANP